MTSGDGNLTVATVTITRELSAAGGDLVYVSYEDGQGDKLPLIEALGMLRMAEDTVIRDAMGEVPDGE